MNADDLLALAADSSHDLIDEAALRQTRSKRRLNLAADFSRSLVCY